MSAPLKPSTHIFRLPDLGEGLTEAGLVTWLVAVGDTITTDQPIAEVETAKSVVELPSPFAGVVTALHGTAGGHHRRRCTGARGHRPGIGIGGGGNDSGCCRVCSVEHPRA